MTAELDGRVLRRGDPGYEEARRDAVWNALRPEGRPEAIVLAASERDVVAAVRLAGREDLRIGIRSGGHSWAGNHLRDGGMLIDVSRLRELSADPGSLTATVQPGCVGSETMAALGERGLFFPGGHCVGVALGGYLLQGGFGWNGRVHGPACQSVEAIDVVTAGGELLRADASDHPDLYWAARGSGPGFFGAVTRFHLRVYPKPKLVANALYSYPAESLEDVFGWAHEVGPQVPREMELMVVVHRDPAGELEVVVTGPVLVDTEEQARSALALLESCPVAGQAKAAVPYLETSLPELYAGVHAAYPDEHRYSVDNMWTGAPVGDLLPGLRRIAETMPGAPSHMLWMNWGPCPPRPDMAYSVEDDTYIALYGVWQDPAEDEGNLSWATERMREMEQHSTGIQLADENLGRRPMRFIAEERMARLDEIRERYDPDRRFHPWMGRP
ncbi:MAG: FAD-binding oxidoreductase [Solirubrobacterales bacterium]